MIIGHTPSGHPIYEHWSQAPWDEERWPNFKPSEFACKGTGRLAYSPATMDKLQFLRKVVGRPFYINSGYRSPEHNAAVGGAENSLHMHGVAIDISMRNHDRKAFYRTAIRLGWDGIGTYPGSNFIHIDTRGYPARWGDPF